jgi:hypothetical protein
MCGCNTLGQLPLPRPHAGQRASDVQKKSFPPLVQAGGTFGLPTEQRQLVQAVQRAASHVAQGQTTSAVDQEWVAEAGLGAWTGQQLRLSRPGFQVPRQSFGLGIEEFEIKGREGAHPVFVVYSVVPGSVAAAPLSANGEVQKIQLGSVLKSVNGLDVSQLGSLDALRSELDCSDSLDLVLLQPPDFEALGQFLRTRHASPAEAAVMARATAAGFWQDLRVQEARFERTTVTVIRSHLGGPLGLGLNQVDEMILVDELKEGSPAWRAQRFQVGAVVLDINGTEVRGQPLSEIQKLVAGASVTFTVLIPRELNAIDRMLASMAGCTQPQPQPQPDEPAGAARRNPRLKRQSAGVRRSTRPGKDCELEYCIEIVIEP